MFFLVVVVVVVVVDTTTTTTKVVATVPIVFANKKCQTDELFFRLFRLFVLFCDFCVNFCLCGGAFSRQKQPLISKI